MARSKDTENASINDQRNGRRDRRVNGERRSEERLRYMKGEYRSNCPRRITDVAGRMIEGELWWSGH